MTRSYNRGGRLLWLDVLKTIAIVAMILLHVSAVGLSEANVGSYAWHVSNLFNSICRFCVPLFVMISGAIFLKRDTSMKKYIHRMVTALVFWTLAYILYASTPQIMGGAFEIRRFINSLFSPTHLWFMWMILCLYLAVPVFRAIVGNKKALERFLVLWVIFGILVPAMKHLPVVGEMLTSVIDQTHFFLILEYGGYFLLGHYLLNNSHRLERYALFYIGLGIIIAAIGTFAVSASIGRTSELFLGYFFPTTFLTAAGIFVYFKNRANDWKISPFLQKTVSFISITSLGIYAVHMFFLAAFHKIGLTYAIYNPIVAIPLLCIITLLLSMGVVSIIKRCIPKGNYIV